MEYQITPYGNDLPQAFPPGKHFQVPPLPNITAVNVLGDFAIAADRLAIIDGEGESYLEHYNFRLTGDTLLVDPWKPDTPHSQYAEDRKDTILQPFKLIPSAFPSCIFLAYKLTDLLSQAAYIIMMSSAWQIFVTNRSK